MGAYTGVRRLGNTASHCSSMPNTEPNLLGVRGAAARRATGLDAPAGMRSPWPYCCGGPFSARPSCSFRMSSPTAAIALAAKPLEI